MVTGTKGEPRVPAGATVKAHARTAGEPPGLARHVPGSGDAPGAVSAVFP